MRKNHVETSKFRRRNLPLPRTVVLRQIISHVMSQIAICDTNFTLTIRKLGVFDAKQNAPKILGSYEPTEIFKLVGLRTSRRSSRLLKLQ